VARAQSTQAAVAASNTPEKFDLGVGAFYQITNASNGNFLREDTTSSGGALVSIHQPWRPWMGYAADVGYTKFYESYNKNTVKLQSNVTDFGFSYLAQGSPIFGAHLFATIGGGIIVFSPISGSKIDVNGELPAHLGSQLLPQFNYSVGVNYPVWGHFGVRGQFRGLIYKTPDFHQNLLNTHTLRSTVEPTIGVYYRF
jgi:Outer membrane protein beta-barrel domain